MGAKSGQKAKRAKSAGAKRLALVIFGALFVVLFVGFAIAQGIGQPSVPSGDVAMVKGVADGNISEADFKRTLAQQVAQLLSQGQLKKAPKPDSKKYEEVKSAAMTELLQATWIRGEAEELGISVTDKQIEAELVQIKKTSFPTEEAFQKFLKTSHLTPDEVNEKVEGQVLVKEIQQKISSQAPPPTSAEISDYYDSEKATQFTVKPSRDVRIVVSRNKGNVEKAKEALDEDDSAANWKIVTAKYSADPTTKSKGGLQKEISEELLQGVLKKAIFGSATGEVVGPVGFQGNYFVVEVEKLNPRKVKTLAEVKSQIGTQLAQQGQEAFFNEFVTDFQSKWTSRTYCASDFLIPSCSNYKGTGHPASAPEACYEANPKTPASECPAPVEQTKPALPGSVTPVKPLGEPLVQRPRPEAGKEPAKEAAEEKLESATPETGE